MFYLLKYTGLLSIPLFLIIAFSLIAQAPGYSYRQHSISKTILFLEHTKYKFLFRLNFIFKAIIDMCFLGYLVQVLHLSYLSPIVWIFVLGSLLFGSLAFILVSNMELLHVIVIYTAIVLWALFEVLVAGVVGVSWFTVFTWLVACISTAIAFWFLYIRNITVVVQVICTVMVYSWLIVFVTKFL